MNASCVTSSTSAWSRMKRDNSRDSLRWYFSTSRLNACLSPCCARVTSCRSISRSLTRAPHPVCNAYVYVPQTRPLGNSSARRPKTLSGGQLRRRHARQLAPQRPDAQAPELLRRQHVDGDENRPSRAAQRNADREAADIAALRDFGCQLLSIRELQRQRRARDLERAHRSARAQQRPAPCG